jgi:carbon monoxide dehydrogenase subunit G
MTNRRWTSRAAHVGGVCLVAVTGVLGAAAAVVHSDTSATPEQLAQMSGTAVYSAPPATLWSFTEDAAGLCRLLPDCLKASAIPGRTDAYTVHLDANGGGLPFVPAMSDAVVRMDITGRTPGQQLTLHISMDNATGTFDSDVVLDLKPAPGGRTTVALTTTSAEGTGVTGRMAIERLADTMQQSLRATGASYSSAKAEMPPTAFTAKVSRRGATGVFVDGTLSVAMPAGFEAPTAKGRMTVYISGRKVCSARVTGLTARCRVPARYSAAGRALVTMSGVLSNGLAINQGASVRLPGAGR